MADCLFVFSPVCFLFLFHSRMEMDSCLLRSRRVPRAPASPDLDSSMDGDEGHPQGNGDGHMAGNGEHSLTGLPWLAQRKDIDPEASMDV